LFKKIRRTRCYLNSIILVQVKLAVDALYELTENTENRFHQCSTSRFCACESAKKTDNLTVFFAFLGSVNVKATCKMLMKLTPEINFINILRTLFLLIFCAKNFKPKTQLCNFWHQNLGAKCVLKCWWNQHQE